ncbi:hypothetical protein B0A52_10087 [Exophiala mesophila]|uniref:DUF7053 domain-containing protein n=1 Tax=Exophiala mesophila TaxID=212818 RepID=A0A438MRC9_EXOME|nr:hypothetical protein B0A52_10087 [Exophiala mesophila]
MMKRKSVFTTITPIPSHIPRQLAIDMLHSHQEIIELNPLVIEVKAIKAPQSAPPDEFFSTWYEITERIKFIPGIGKAGTGKISFHGCFHDMPWGLQTHVYAPMGVDLRNKWQIRGNQQGEPPETRELGSGAPASGLYLREDIEIKCNPTMLGFVKKEMKASSKTMVDRLVKKAELIDAGVLSAMFDQGKLKTSNPADRSQNAQGHGHYSPGMPPGSPHAFPPGSPANPAFPQSAYPYSAHPNSAHPQSAYARQSQYGYLQPPQGLAIEMPGSTHYAPNPAQQYQQQQHYQPPGGARFSSNMSELSASSPQQSQFPMNSSTSDRQSYAASVSSHPSSYQHGDDRMYTPGNEKRAFVAELPGSHENIVRDPPKSPDPNSTPNSQQTPQQTPPQTSQQQQSPQLQPQQQQQQQQPPKGFQGLPSQQRQYSYNPQDYARVS